MNLIAHIIDAAVAPHDKRFAEIRLDPLPLCVYPHQPQLLPAPLYHILHTQIQFTRHHSRARLSGQVVEEVQTNRVYLVVHVQATDVFPVVLHDDIDEVVDRGVLVSDEHLTIEHFVVAEDVVQHLLIEVLGWGREGYFHAAGFLLLEVDVGWFAVEADADRLELGFEEGTLLGTFGGVKDHENEVGGLN